MAYLTVFAGFNLSAQGVTPEGKQAPGSYDLDSIKGNVQVKFNKEIYATHNGTKYTFIPANTYVNLVKNSLTSSQYVYSARTTTNASSWSFPAISPITYSINIPDVINNPTVTGSTNAGTGITATIRLSATTTSSIAIPTRTNAITLSSACTRCCTFTLTPGTNSLSGYKIMELRHLDINSGGTYMYNTEWYSLVGNIQHIVKYYTPYSGNTFMINRMTNDVGTVVCTFNSSTLAKSVNITGQYNTSPNGKILTSKLLTKIYPYAFDTQSVHFNYGNDNNGGLVFTVSEQSDGINDVHSSMPNYSDGATTSIFSGFTKNEISAGSLDYAVRCDELLCLGMCQDTMSHIGNVVHTRCAYIAINDSDKTQNLQGNVAASFNIPFVSGIDNEFELTWSGSTSKVDSATIYNGNIRMVTNRSNVDETGYLKITAKGERSSVASVTITIYANKQSCSDCDNCNDSSSCQYT